MQFSYMQKFSYIHTNNFKIFQNLKVNECKRVGRRVPSSKLVREVWWPAVKDPFFIREGGKSGGAGSGGGG